MQSCIVDGCGVTACDVEKLMSQENELKHLFGKLIMLRSLQDCTFGGCTVVLILQLKY